MEPTNKTVKPAPKTEPKDKVTAAYETIAKDAKTRPGDYVKASTVPGGGE